MSASLGRMKSRYRTWPHATTGKLAPRRWLAASIATASQIDDRVLRVPPERTLNGLDLPNTRLYSQQFRTPRCLIVVGQATNELECAVIRLPRFHGSNIGVGSRALVPCRSYKHPGDI